MGIRELGIAIPTTSIQPAQYRDFGDRDFRDFGDSYRINVGISAYPL